MIEAIAFIPPIIILIVIVTAISYSILYRKNTKPKAKLLNMIKIGTNVGIVKKQNQQCILTIICLVEFIDVQNAQR